MALRKPEAGRYCVQPVQNILGDESIYKDIRNEEEKAVRRELCEESCTKTEGKKRADLRIAYGGVSMCIHNYTIHLMRK